MFAQKKQGLVEHYGRIQYFRLFLSGVNDPWSLRAHLQSIGLWYIYLVYAVISMF